MTDAQVDFIENHRKARLRMQAQLLVERVGQILGLFTEKMVAAYLERFAKRNRMEHISQMGSTW